jgi:acetylornithine deacetylase/succinyl-diaminopimelate desuccinylase-like protein
MDLIAARLGRSGFDYERMDRAKPPNRVRNLWARHGTEKPVVCLAGHIDVVPPADPDLWTSDPFEPTERDGRLFGRGAANMKTSVAAMITAAERFVAARPDHQGTLALMLTSDAKGRARQGTASIVEQLQWRGEAIDACILGEPTSVSVLGDTIRSGAQAEAPPPKSGLADALSAAVTLVTRVTPQLSTSDGMSDGRFLSALSGELVEFGPVGVSADAVDEHVLLADVGRLSEIYEQALMMLLGGT